MSKHKILSTYEAARMIGWSESRMRQRLLQDHKNKKTGGIVYFPNSRKLEKEYAVLHEDVEEYLVMRSIEQNFPTFDEAVDALEALNLPEGFNFGD